MGLPSLFQVDGVGGLDARPNGNFNAYISGLDKIRVIHCNPQINVQANGGNSIDFGTLSAAKARPGDRRSEALYHYGEVAGWSVRRPAVAGELQYPEAGYQRSLVDSA
ncbi:hypothetical protein NMD75_12930 [Edwardsiella tarda]